MKAAVRAYGKYGFLLIAVLFVFVGLLRGEHLTVLKKAVNICLECIGLG